MFHNSPRGNNIFLEEKLNLFRASFITFWFSDNDGFYDNPSMNLSLTLFCCSKKGLNLFEKSTHWLKATVMLEDVVEMDVHEKVEQQPIGEVMKEICCRDRW